MRYVDEYPEYIPVAQRRANAERKLKQLRKTQPHVQPVITEGRTLAKTWWGKSWNQNLERYADFAYRMERGRSYVRHRSVLDLQLQPGHVSALVLGSQPAPYDVDIHIDTLSAPRWHTIRQACEGRFDSLSELLAGVFPQALKDLFFDAHGGLFPTPGDIHFDCSCPDWASMCKHVAAALYGVGSRLDDDAALFFTLRAIPIDDIISQTVAETTQALLDKTQKPRANILDDVDLGEMFGIELDGVETPGPHLPPGSTTVDSPKRTTRAKPAPSARKRVAVSKKHTASRRVNRQSHPASTVKASPPSAAATQRRTPRGVAAPPQVSQGTMLDALVKAVGRARSGKSVDQLQEKLGWTKTQVRSAIRRASARGLLETVRPGRYRQTV
jgi:uncharacterized Zn finger protein